MRTAGGRLRRKKRYYLLGATLVFLFLWYVIIALGLTGHTKVLWGMDRVAQEAGHVARKIDERVGGTAGLPQHDQPRGGDADSGR